MKQNQTKKSQMWFLTLFSVFFSILAYGQVAEIEKVPEWTKLSSKDDANFYEIQRKTIEYYTSRGLDTVKGSGYKQFLRWSKFWETRVGVGDNSGSFKPAMSAYAGFFKSGFSCQGSIYGEQWQFVGHNSTESGNTGYNWGKGQGVLNVVYPDLVHDPSGNTVYAGSRTGGLWRTRNANSTNPTWKCLTDTRLPGLGINGIAIDPNNSNIIYISTGMSSGDDASYGMGILKTMDGQQDNPIWNVTDLSTKLGTPHDIIMTNGVFLHPGNSNIVFGFSEHKIFRSTNGGNTFALVHTVSGGKRNLLDLVFLPSNSSILFASTFDSGLDDGGAAVLKSTNGGLSWTDITSSLGFVNLNERIDLATTAANGSLIMAAIAGVGGPCEISTSTNSGVSWTRTTSTNPGNSKYFRNDIVISPDNPNVVYRGGDQLAKSSNGGVNFTTLYGYYDNIVHPDVRGVFIRKGGVGGNQDVVYLANDGGLSITEDGGSTFLNKNGTGLSITQIYGFDINLRNDWKVVGTQDLGFYNQKNGVWKNYTHGDGFDIIFNPYSSTESVIGQVNNSYLMSKTYASTSNSWSSVTGNGWIAGCGNREMAYDIMGNLYIGHNACNGTPNKNLYRRAANSSTFTSIGQFPAAQYRISGIGVNKSNPDVIYISFEMPTWASGTPSNRLFKTVNGQSANPTWVDISAGLNGIVNWMGISELIVDPTDPNKIWVITGNGFLGGGQTVDRVYYSSNGGSSYTAISNGLSFDGTSPIQFPINCAVLDEATGGMYIGTDVGVYYHPNPTTNTSSDPEDKWHCYNAQLPTAIVTDIKIDYCGRKVLVSTFGRGLWEAGLAESPDKNLTYTTAEHLSVPTGETRLYFSDITIPTGSTVTVNGTVKMAPGRRITVQPGAKLLVDGGLITSTCDLPWGGVVIEGNLNASQIPISNQGFVEMKNQATISNAVDAIRVTGLNSAGNIHWGMTGGIIRATDSQFKNNKRDVEFIAFRNMYNGNELNNLSYFRNTHFTTDDDNNIPNSEFWPHVTMYKISGVKFSGCTFEDLRTTIPKWEGRTGIYSLESNYNVGPYCAALQIPCIGIPSEFNNLRIAIESADNGSRGIINIERSHFNSYKGVLLQGINNATVLNNTFNIEHDPITAGNTSYPYGLYLDKCNMFNTEGNQFTGIGNAQMEGAAGLVIRNSGANNNDFYRSNFDNLKLGSQVLSANKSWYPFIGLEFTCNEYNNNWNDLDIRDDYLSPTVSLSELGMREYQGFGLLGVHKLPANQFSNNSPILNENIENNGNHLNYLYPGSPAISNSFWPVNVTPNVSLSSSTLSNSCPDRTLFWGMDRPMLVAKLDNIFPMMMFKLGELKQLTDNDDTPGLVAEVINVNPGNVGQVVNDLMLYSPYLSETVLAKVANADYPFAPEDVRDVLMANPHSSRSAQIQEVLDNRINLLPVSFRNDINSVSTVYTEMDNRTQELSGLTSDYDNTLSELLYSYLEDENAHLDEYENWFLHPINPSYHYQLAKLHYDNDDWLKYSEVMNAIPTVIDLTQSELDYHATFDNLFQQLHMWDLNGEEIYGDFTKRDWLLNFALVNPNYPTRVNSLLGLFDSKLMSPNIIIHVGPSEYLINITENEVDESDELLLFPNPVNDVLTLKWDEKSEIADIEVYNMLGERVKSTKWISLENSIDINVQDLTDGAYMIMVRSGSKEFRKLFVLSTRE